MHGEVFKLWATEFGQVELTASQLLRGASKQLRDLLLNVAADQSRRRICPRRLGHWLASILGKADGGWRLERREVHNQSSWRIVEAPVVPVPSDFVPLVFDPDAKAPDLLNRNVKRGLERIAEALEFPYDKDDPKINNLILGAAAASLNTAVKVDQNRLQAERSPDALERVIARVKQLVQERNQSNLLGAPAVDHAAPTVVEEPLRQVSFDEFNRLKEEPAAEPLEEEPEPEPPSGLEVAPTHVHERHCRSLQPSRPGFNPPCSCRVARLEEAKARMYAPGPVVTTEGRQELSAVEQAMRWQPPR